MQLHGLDIIKGQKYSSCFYNIFFCEIYRLEKTENIQSSLAMTLTNTQGTECIAQIRQGQCTVDHLHILVFIISINSNVIA